MESLGELERDVMDALWSAADGGLSAAGLRDVLADRGLALTTVHTVLTRLEKKGFVNRDRGTRPHLYSAASSKEEHVTDLLSEVLDQAGDRRAVLARFLGTVSLSDSAFLRGVLDSRLRGTR
ncbi:MULTISPECIES: BlaI/MecI/CopY family transcriptional regulator [Brevibacterium]|uniref:Transcriptional regulator n=1 Tax=Brevibacterium salitolerans TaxID=1403566 RepID=A0ABP5IU11_9MICO|nr:BlaI/MecI/CopY family transcriptional regulator [Brevibacterium sp.]